MDLDNALANQIRLKAVANIIWGIVNIYIGYQHINDSPVNIILVVLGGIMLLIGLGLMLSPHPNGVIVAGLSLILIGIWNIVVALVNNGHLQPDDASAFLNASNINSFWLFLGLVQIGWGWKEMTAEYAFPAAPTPPLHEAAMLGKKDEVEQLISKKNINLRDEDGKTPLHRAKSGEIAEVLLAHGADVNAKDDFGATPLHAAVFGCHLDVLNVLLAHGADIHAKDQNGNTPLHGARSSEIAEVLLAHGADINAKSESGATPLHDASSSEIAEVLLAHGADVSAKSNRGETPLHEAARYGRDGRLDVLKVLLAHGADVNAKSDLDWTPLHRTGSGRIAEVLLAHGADVNAKNKVGASPLYSAASLGYLDVLNCLLAHGADVNAISILGDLPLHVVVRMGEYDAAKRLLEHGSPVNVKSKVGETPLKLAYSLSKNRDEFIQLLRQYGGEM